MPQHTPEASRRMKVTVHFLGILGDYFGTPRADVDVGAPATRQGLLEELGRRFGSRLPEQLWDHHENCFIPGVHLIGRNGDLVSPESPLAEEDEVNILMPIAGGAIWVAGAGNQESR